MIYVQNKSILQRKCVISSYLWIRAVKSTFVIDKLQCVGLLIRREQVPIRRFLRAWSGGTRHTSRAVTQINVITDGNHREKKLKNLRRSAHPFVSIQRSSIVAKWILVDEGALPTCRAKSKVTRYLCGPYSNLTHPPDVFLGVWRR
jgi:hypothetical protein